jgi:hypothetical protein
MQNVPRSRCAFDQVLHDSARASRYAAAAFASNWPGSGSRAALLAATATAAASNTPINTMIRLCVVIQILTLEELIVAPQWSNV